MDKPIAIITRGIIETVNFVVNSNSKRYLSFILSNDELFLLYILSEKFLINQLERGFSSLDFYKSLL